MSKVLITGGAGFLGLHLAKRLLKDAHEIDLLDNFSRGVSDRELETLASQRGIHLIEKDLLDAEALKDVGAEYDSIYHLAAIVGVANVLNKPYSVLAENNLMTLNALALAKRQKALKRFVFSSTSEVYAGTLQHFKLPVPTPETTPLALTDLDHPRTSYMLSKIYGEALCHQSGVPFTVIRPHNIYGPRMGMSHVIPELFRKAYETRPGGPIELASPDHLRAFCYVDDAIEMIARSAESDSCRDKTLNIGNSEHEISIKELALRIFRMFEKDLTVIEGKASPGSPVRRCPDMQLTARLTGYSPQADLNKGLKLTLDWYLKNIFVEKGVCAR